MDSVKCLGQEHGDRWVLYLGDCCEVLQGLPKGSVGYSIFSPPFADLYCYSGNERDMANCTDYGEFMRHFCFLVEGLLRVVKPGRVVSVHCMELPLHKERDGMIGVRDFPGDIVRAFVKGGFIYHCRHVLWTDPLIAATRTKALGLLHKQLMKDSAMCRAGLQTYLVSFRAPGENPDPIAHPDGLRTYCGSDDPGGGGGIERSHMIWRAYASPVWMDIRQTRVLDSTIARDPRDEKHVCPLQLDVIERACVLWSNPEDVVLSPFAGIGSELYVAVTLGRRAVGMELKESYFRQSVKNLRTATARKAAGNGFGLFMGGGTTVKRKRGTV